ncbi:MAG: flagellar biosynthetic protein FlhB [Halioglobus sp.]|jgi:flagellar biosynthetic protein FlhB
MADNEPDKSEKTETATPFKVEEARKKGSVAKSMEVNSFMILTGGLLFLVAAGKQFVDSALALCASMLSSAGQVNFQLTSFLLDIGYWTFGGIDVLAPLISIVIIIGVLSTLIQIGGIFSFSSIKPDINRINPVQGFKKFFTIKLLYESLKSVLKLILFSAVTYFTLISFVEPMMDLYQRHHGSYVQYFIDHSADLIFRLLIILAFVAVVDWLFTRWDYQQNLKMTRKELKDEMKRREGDPKVRQKRKELERELRQRSETLANLPQADLVITNPTRFAVLLKYDRKTMIAPTIMGKGAGDMAKLIRQKAYHNRIPVIQSPRLARTIFTRCKINSAIPEEHYVAVAKVLKQAYEMRRQQQADFA